jgi:hypothetical protein
MVVKGDDKRTYFLSRFDFLNGKKVTSGVLSDLFPPLEILLKCTDANAAEST